MKHLTWITLAGLLFGAGCTADSSKTASVQLDETTEIPVASAQKETVKETDGIGAEVEVEVEVDLGEEEETETAEVVEAVVISMTSNGFEPNTVTIKAGETVTFVNNDSIERWPASAFHPTHQELPGFDAIGGVAPGASYSFTFTEVGTWKFHDHLNPSVFGAITVE